MPEERLDVANVRPLPEEVRREQVSEPMGTHSGTCAAVPQRAVRRSTAFRHQRVPSFCVSRKSRGLSLDRASM